MSIMIMETDITRISEDQLRLIYTEGVKMRIAYGMCLILLLIACGGGEGEYSENEVDSGENVSTVISSDPVEMSEWTEYLQSSDTGLWEDDPEHIKVISSVNPMYGDLDEIQVYSPFAVCCYSDTIFVTDASTCEILALREDGSVVWRAGGEGEGPGEFSMITTLAASSRYIAASNIHLGRIELFSRDGSYEKSIQFERAQDIVFLDDSTFIVGSTEEQGGDFHIVDATLGIVESFGEVNVDDYDEVLRPDLIRLCLNTDGRRIAAFNRYEGLLAIYDLPSRECIYRGSREYPAAPTPPVEHITDTGESRLIYFPIGGNVFLGSEGMLNVVVCNYMEDGSFLSDPEYLDFAPITAIDRYDWDGNYLDSYCLPDSCLNYVTLLSDDRMVAKSFAEGTLYLLE